MSATTAKRSLNQVLKKKERKPKADFIKLTNQMDIASSLSRLALRPKKPKNYSIQGATTSAEDDEEFVPEPEKEDEVNSSDEEFLSDDDKPKSKKRIKKNSDVLTVKKSLFKEIDMEDVYEDEATTKAEAIEEALDKIPSTKRELELLRATVKDRLQHFKQLFIQEQFDMEKKKSTITENAIPISADVRTFDFKQLAEVQSNIGGRLFDVIMMDPPWQLSSSQPSRGVAIAYSSLADEFIQKIPVPKLQENGFIFIWTINAKYATTARLIEHWGYELVDEITWIKKTINGKIAKGHGFYLQHAKESCLIGVKGNIDPRVKKNVCKDIIFSQRRGQSQKPEEVYTLIEKLVPDGYYLEIFGRRNNIRDRWVTIGNEL